MDHPGRANRAPEKVKALHHAAIKQAEAACQKMVFQIRRKKGSSSFLKKRTKKLLFLEASSKIKSLLLLFFRKEGLPSYVWPKIPAMAPAPLPQFAGPSSVP
jgi:hypothetical protein